MREIKFRAWDRLREEWVYLPESGNIDLVQYDESITFDCLEEIEIMQYTGLKDKNGKDIYEGDVVCYEGREVQNGRQVYPVRFRTIIDYVEDTFHLRCVMSGSTRKHAEVIGNIHENPELLELRAPYMAQEARQENKE
jgi:uncharacterized phage protein (TIGR01671 family)